MLELKVVMDFECSICRHSMGVTLKCSGKGIVSGKNPMASIKIPCPTCHSVNEIFFRPSGELHHVAPYWEYRYAPEPSLN